MDPVAGIYKYLDKKNIRESEEFKRSSSRFRPSEITKCSRQIYYRLEGVKPSPMPGFINLYGMDGDVAHDTVRWLLLKSGAEMDGLKFDEETGAVDELDFIREEITHNGETFTLSGRGDGRIKVDGEWMYLEIKSVDGFKAKYINKAYQEGELAEYLEKKYPNFLAQCTLCADGLNLKKTYLVFKDRSLCQIGLCDKNFNRAGYILDVDEALRGRLLNKMAMITKARREQAPPMREYVEGSKECKQCNFAGECYGTF